MEELLGTLAVTGEEESSRSERRQPNLVARPLSPHGHASSSDSITLWSLMTADDRQQYLDLLNRVLQSSQFAAWFWSYVEKREEGCWHWSHTRTKKGYGVVSLYPFGIAQAHRVAYQMTHGPVPDGQVVLHQCDNRACVNPEHLRVGSQRDNIHDRIAKGRSVYARGDQHGSHTMPERTPRGTQHHLAKFTEEDILEIRRLFDTGMATVSQLSRRFQTGSSHISNIVKRRRWKHLP
jgi:hypothetical protein